MEPSIKKFYSEMNKTGSTWLPVKSFKDTSSYVIEGDLCSLPALRDKEAAVASALVSYYKNGNVLDEPAAVSSLIEEYGNETGIHLHPVQEAAVRMIVKYPLCILTGGPGTGKTATLKCAMWILEHLTSANLLLTAPTGKAAMHLGEVCGEDASTLHKVLGIGYEDEVAENTLDNDVDEHYLFIDEASMIDLTVANVLANTINTFGKVVFIGDVDQLPSVGAGAFLRDIIDAGVFPVTKLTQTFRQKGESGILSNIMALRNARPVLKSFEDCKFKSIPLNASYEEVDSIIFKEYERLKAKNGDDIAVLLPFRQKCYCSNRLNNLLQKRYNTSDGNAWTVDINGQEVTFKEGDLVMQTVNRMECVNGEVGTVTEVTEDYVRVAYTLTEVDYFEDDIGQLTLAYSLTVTKSQGSEYASVIVCMLDEHSFCLNKNALYTAISRGKKEVTVFIQTKAYKECLRKTADSRVTKLKERINECTFAFVA